MKSLQYVILNFLILIFFDASSQNTSPKVQDTIYVTKSDRIQEFYGFGKKQNKEVVVDGVVLKSFILSINNDRKPSKVKGKTTFRKYNYDFEPSDKSGLNYLIENLTFFPDSANASLRLYYDGQSKDSITVNILQKPAGDISSKKTDETKTSQKKTKSDECKKEEQQASEKKCDSCCVDIKRSCWCRWIAKLRCKKKKITIIKDPPCSLVDREHFFGESFASFETESGLYDKHKIVYVYDFSRDPNKRRLYKVRATRDGTFLKTSIVNPSKERLLPSSFVQLKLINVNKFLYDVSLTGSPVYYNSQPSPLFNSLFLGDSTILKKMISTYSSGINVEKNVAQNKGGGNEEIEIDNKVKVFTDSLDNFYDSLNVWRAQILNAYDPCYKFKCCCERPHFAYARIASQLSWIKRQLPLINSTIRTSKAQAKDDSTQIAKCKDPKADCKKDSVKLVEELDLLKYKIQAYSAALLLAANLPSEKELMRMTGFINHIVWTNYMQVAGPIATEGQKMDFVFRIKSKDTIANYFGVPQYADTIRLSIPVLRKAFVSFSSGSFVATHNSLQNNTYAWQVLPGAGNTVGDSLRYRLVGSGVTPWPTGFSAFGNLEWKFSRNFGVGASVGVGLTLEKTPRPGYMCGASLFFGNVRQFAITYGLLFMNVNKIQSNWKAVADQGIIYTKPPVVTYSDDFRVGTFVSFSYTPFKVSKGKKSTSSAAPDSPKKVIIKNKK